MSYRIVCGDVFEQLALLEDESVHCCVTSPPYFGLRSYLPDDHPDKAKELGAERVHDCFGYATGAPCGECYICHQVAVFREVRRVLRSDGTCWVNIGDSYNAHPGQRKITDKAGDKQVTNNGAIGAASRNVPGLKPKDLIMIPARFALALQQDGWWLRSDIIWHKPNPMPESVTDRPTKAHEYVFLLTKAERYFYDADAIREQAVADHPAGNKSHKGATAYENGDERHRTKQGLVAYAERTRRLDQLQGSHGTTGHDGNGMRMPEKWNNPAGRNKRTVWTLATMATPEAHFATFPLELPELCMKAGCPERGTVLDPFAGAGTTGLACLKNNREFIGIELNPQYIDIAYDRARKYYPLLMGGAA